MKRVVSLLFLCFALACSAQYVFEKGETLQYSLYYNWKFVWVKAGSATMTVLPSNYASQPAFRTQLLMRGSKKADGYFTLRDTLLSYTSQSSLQPLRYSKKDIEGSSRRKREVWYSYSDGKSHVRQQYQHSDGHLTEKSETFSGQVYDMLSIMLKARTYNTADWKPGKRIQFLMTDGNGVSAQTLIYRGKYVVKIRNKEKSYTCLKFSFVEKQSNKEKEVITFFVTDDKYHLPVRLDMYLRFGSAKAYLESSNYQL